MGKKKLEYLNKVFYKNSQTMKEVPNDCIDLIVTSPPYFNTKDYSKDGHQINSHSKKNNQQIGDINTYKSFIKELLKVWKECERVLRPNGKMVINTPLVPMKKKEYSTHQNRHIFDLALLRNSYVAGTGEAQAQRPLPA